ncbi:hypothetical protein EYC59_04240 [Candidatus Saccharibacteria bacterium]|nr:MAG: hypothetical protein EYC59_04240 [Candidatus Saccharibacteria bacterium]
MWIPSPTHTSANKPPQCPEGQLLPRVVLATPYGPEATDEIPDETFAYNVLGQVIDCWESTRVGNPDFFSGLTIRGSFVKGRARLKSDLDLFLFFDPSQTDSTDPYEQLEHAQAKIVDDFRTPLSEALLHRGFSDTLATPELDVYSITPASIVSCLRKWVEQFEWELDSKSCGNFIPVNITALFHPQLGGGAVQDLRVDIITQLQNHKLGAQMWECLMKEIKRNEEWNRGADIFFADTRGRVRLS